MSIFPYREELVSALGRLPVPSDIRNETDLEIRFIIPAVADAAAHFPDVRTFTHPWSNRRRCQPDCETAALSHEGVPGCPRCWAASKEWATVSAFGTHHTFDVVARDLSGKSLAVEAKLVHTRGVRRPSGEIQRLLGQCSLAKSKHDYVVGVYVCRGGHDGRADRDTETVTTWFKKAGIVLVFRVLDRCCGK